MTPVGLSPGFFLQNFVNCGLLSNPHLYNDVIAAGHAPKKQPAHVDRRKGWFNSGGKDIAVFMNDLPAYRFMLSTYRFLFFGKNKHLIINVLERSKYRFLIEDC